MVKKVFALIAVVAGIIGFASFAVSQSEKAPGRMASTAAEALPLINSLSLPDSKEEPLTTPEDGAKVGSEKDKKKQDDPKADDLYSQVELFSYALTTIKSEYVERKTAKDLIYGALAGMLSSLDPHSQFLPPDEYDELKTDTQGKFGGLGIEISIRDGLLTVVTPIEDTPAWKVGLKAGDRIVKIEKNLTRDMTLNEAVKKLRGEPGTSVHITVLRESESKIHDFDITREIIRIQDVKDSHIVDDNIAYLRLVEFRENSYEQVYKNLKELKDKGATALILDLRNDPGGLLNVAISISEMFLPAGKTIVSTKGRHPAEDTVAISKNSEDEFKDWPIVVLINEGSASGSEILAGALKDNRRAVTLGVKSFGKGSVQSVIPLPDGSGLRLTTAKYFTPSGVCIHEIGITPDIVLERTRPASEEDEGTEAEPKKKSKDNAKKVFKDIEMKGISDPNEIEKKKREESLKQRMTEDNQIQSAISVIKGIRVYKKLQTETTDATAKK
ncbi:MAG: S41 family peptidase [Candidatus Omnitrophica bacterium]|nr:S41 family peptidase [Candidatus Omnitrophota bacterium]